MCCAFEAMEGVEMSKSQGSFESISVGPVRVTFRGVDWGEVSRGEVLALFVGEDGGYEVAHEATCAAAIVALQKRVKNGKNRASQR